MTFLEPGDVFDQCLIGSASVNGEVVAVYNKMAVIVAMSNDRGITPEEAFDELQSSIAIQGELRDVTTGEPLPQTPIFVTDVRDM